MAGHPLHFRLHSSFASHPVQLPDLAQATVLQPREKVSELAEAAGNHLFRFLDRLECVDRG